MPKAKRHHRQEDKKESTHRSHASHHHAAKKLKLSKKYIWLGSAGVVGLLALGILGILLRATEGNVQARLIGNKILPVEAPITIHLNQDLKVNKGKIKLTPADNFTYKFTNGAFGQTDIVITPKKALKNNHEYKLELSGLQHMVSRRQVPSQTFSFRTELAPGIAAFSPSEGTITRDTVFRLVATDYRTAHRNYELMLEPKTDLKATFDGKTTWTWRPKDHLPQGTDFKLKLTGNKKVLQDTGFKTVAEPKITAASAKSYFYPDEKIAVSFDKPMRTDQKDALKFDLPGKGEWMNDTNYIFTPDKLERNKEYAYTMKAGFTSKDGGVIEADKTYKIKTPGPATVVGASPFGSNLSRGVPIRFSFDQPVNHQSAEARFSIEPGVNGSFRWENNTLIFTPSGYDWQTTYTARINPGVEAVYGVPSTQIGSVRFSTELQTKKLNVPAYRQAFKLSCEAAALRMALAYKGVQTDDMSITQRMGYSPRPLSNGEWDDPYSQFVGDINGKQWNNTGYGAYAPPVAAAARSYGKSAAAGFGVSANWIAEQIHADRPVVVWGYQYTPTKFSWKTPGGQTIQAWQGEHTRTVVGVVGKASAPQGFYVADPSYGSVSYWSVGSLMANMNVHGGLSNQAVVVY